MLSEGGRFDLVVGANEERLSAPDLERTLELLGPSLSTSASFTLVGARDGLFHPKSYYVELADGSRHAAIGSANFTSPGIGHNVEACIFLDDATDDPATLDAARDAILSWRDRAATGARDARPVTPQYIRDLEAERIIDPIPAPRSSIPGGSTATGKSSFPALKRIPGVSPSRPRKAPRSVTPGVQLKGAPSAFPLGAVGITKRLSARTDVKGFTSAGGTPYIALPANQSDLAGRLPMRPYGKNGEPRLDLVIQARLLEAAAHIVTSGTDTTNITYVGMGTTKTSKIDLRLNVHHTVMDGLRYVASQNGLPLPKGSDCVAIEFLEEGRLARLTFVSSEPVLGVLRSLLIPGRSWGWLSAGIMPAW
jgi:hypothetical protein